MRSIEIALVGGLLLAACSSSSGGLKTDAGSDTMAVGTGGAGGGGGAGGAACTPMGSSVATVNVSPTWTCFEGACSTELTACAADCVCNNAILTALSCVATTGDQVGCFTTAATSGGTGAITVALCLRLASVPGAPCGPPRDGGATDGATSEGGATEAGGQ